MIRRLFGFLAGFFSNTVFYSDKFGVKIRGELKKYSTAGAEGRPLKAATVSLVCALATEVGRGETAECTIHGVTSRGAHLGNWKVTIERL